MRPSATIAMRAGLLLGLDVVARGVVAGDDQQARCVAVEPMDDAGAQVAADGDIGVAGEQRIHECAAQVAGRWVDNHARRLIDNHYIGVLVHRVQRDIFGDQISRPRDGPPHGNEIPGVNRRARPGIVAVEQDMRVFDQLARVGAREIGHHIGHILIEPRPIRVRADHQLDYFLFHARAALSSPERMKG